MSAPADCPQMIYCYSQPLTSSDGAVDIDNLDIDTEWSALKLISTGSLHIQRRVATAEALQDVLISDCALFHYSGHGSIDGLALENLSRTSQYGRQHHFDHCLLSDITPKQTRSTIQLAVIVACQSQSAGNAFVAAGVPHVIAVDGRTDIADRTALTFTTAFYGRLLEGDTVLHAYEQALIRLKIDPSTRVAKERLHFMLLPAHQDEHHDVTLFSPQKTTKKHIEQSDELLPPLLPPPTYLIGRNSEVQIVVSKLVCAVTNQHCRTLTLIGPLGVGKTCLAIASAHYLKQRSAFRHFVYVDCQELEKTQPPPSIASLCARAMNLDPFTATDDQLISQINASSESYLFIFDQAEVTFHTPHNTPQSLRDFLSTLINKTKNTCHLLTSIIPLRKDPKWFSEMNADDVNDMNDDHLRDEWSYGQEVLLELKPLSLANNVIQLFRLFQLENPITITFHLPIDSTPFDQWQELDKHYPKLGMLRLLKGIPSRIRLAAQTPDLCENDIKSLNERADSEYRDKLCALRAAPISPDDAQTFNIPKQNNTYMKRSRILSAVATAFGSVREQKSTVFAVVHGTSGVGKTQFAINFIRYSAYRADVRAWFPAETSDRLLEAYNLFAEEMGIAIPNASRPMSAVKNWLKKKQALLVYDNVTSYDAIEDWLPDGEANRILLTSQSSQWPDSFKQIKVDTMEEAEAVTLVKLLSKQQDDKEIIRLVHELGCLPLALAQASAFIRAVRGCTVAQYLHLYSGKPYLLLADNRLPGGCHHVPVAVTWDVTLAHIEQAEDNASLPRITRSLMTAAAYMSPEMIPDLIMLEWMEEAFPHIESHEIVYYQIKSRLDEYSVITSTENAFSIHRLLQEILRHQRQVKSAQDESWCRTIISGLMKAYRIRLPGTYRATEDKDKALLSSMETFIMHVDRLWPDNAVMSEHLTASKAELLGAIGTELDEERFLERAAQADERATELLKQLSQKSDKYEVEYARLLLNLSVVVGRLGENDRKLSLALQAMEIEERHPNDIELVGRSTTYTIVGNAYNWMNDEEKAREFLQKGLELRRQAGKKSLIATSLYFIANLHEPAESIPLLLEAIHLFETTDGESFMMARAMSSLADEYEEAKNYKEAVLWARKAFVIIAAKFAPTHDEYKEYLDSLMRLLDEAQDYQGIVDECSNTIKLSRQYMQTDSVITWLHRLAQASRKLNDFEAEQKALLEILNTDIDRLTLKPSEEARMIFIFCLALKRTEQEERAASMEVRLEQILRSEQKLFCESKSLPGDAFAQCIVQSRCTYAVTDDSLCLQRWFSCLTCDLVGHRGCCSVCAVVCHDKHVLSEERISRFYCDCSDTSACTFHPETSSDSDTSDSTDEKKIP